MAYNFASNLPAFDFQNDLFVFIEVLRRPELLASGLPYSLTLMAILLAHEFGHYFACLYYRIGASLPYFLPAPTFIGTFGAFIRFRSAVHGRKQLFDVGIAGPLAGFIFTIPALGIGMALSRVVPGISHHGEISFGTPLIMRAMEMFLFPGAGSVDISLHPVARAAWVGLLATALNLLPVGQLDGGHIVYAFAGEKHKYVTWTVLAALVPLGFVYWPWWVWAAILFLVGRRHFAVVDTGSLGRGRHVLVVIVALVFVLSFIPAPVQYNNEQGFLP